MATVTPGGPGIPPRWTSSAKTGVGTALSAHSRVWFTLSHGICNEIYYPRIDKACIRDMELLVTDGMGFLSEEKRDAESKVEWLAKGVPAFRLINTCRAGRYRIEKEIVTDPDRDTFLQKTRFIPLQGALSDYHLFVLLAPHLGNRGQGNSAWLDAFEDQEMLFANRDDNALALACSAPWLKCSVGYVGATDGWSDLKKHHEMTLEFTQAEYGNVALMAEIDLSACEGEFTLALGFGPDGKQAARNATASLRDGFDEAKSDYISGWQAWIRTHPFPEERKFLPDDLAHRSLAILRTHESKEMPGAFIASLAIPWGYDKGDEDQGGYHLIWSRDMVETTGGLLAAGAHGDMRRALVFLRNTQLSDGHWPQNMWLDGSPYWNGIQMDETALPILLVDLAHREHALSDDDLAGFWPMVKKAAGYLAWNGPVSPQDRWEEDPGYSPFTVAAEIAALLAAADLADRHQESAIGAYLRELADVWNDSIDRWMYATGTDWCRKFGVAGYYLRIAPRENALDASHRQKDVLLKNVVAAEDSPLAIHLVSPDALALVRFGLRHAGDPRICDTVKVIDSLLKVETPLGSTWHRYNGDGYGEHADGAPFDGTGIGRGWPLLTGERAHYELAAGCSDAAQQLARNMAAFAGENGLLPEQVWDGPAISDRDLYPGRPSGSAMPLVWAHAEYLKLRRSLSDGRLFDLPPQTVQRYLRDKTTSPRSVWRFNHKLRLLVPGKQLRIETLQPSRIRWSHDDWITEADMMTRSVGLGIHFADLPTQSLAEGGRIRFTCYWPEAGHWEGRDFLVEVGVTPQETAGSAALRRANDK